MQKGDEREARNLARAVLGLVLVLAGLASIAGIALAPFLTSLVAKGFAGPTRDLTITLVKILFPMAGLLVVSAWCLGVLNVHRRFFLSYAAPAAWNIAQIGVLVAMGVSLAGGDLATAVAWGALVGGAAQLLIQLPTVWRSGRVLTPSFGWASNHVKLVVKGWLPVVAGAGVMQISSIIDTRLGSHVGQGAVVSLNYAQLLQILPVSIFGISVAAVALPELSRETASMDVTRVAERLRDGIGRIVFYILPSAFALAGFAGAAVALLYQSGSFSVDDTSLVAGIVAAYAIGLPGHAMVKILATGHWAMGDTKTPVLVAAVSVTLAALLAFGLMRTSLGVAGIALGSSVAVYVNIVLNGHLLARKVGAIVNESVRRGMLVSLTAALAAYSCALLLSQLMTRTPYLVGAPVVLGGFGVSYVAVARMLGHGEAIALIKRIGL